MPKSYDEIKNEYAVFKARVPQTQLSLSDFARAKDEANGVEDRQEAYNATGLIKIAKDVNSAIDRGIGATGLPEVGRRAGEFIGEGVDSALGTNIAPTVASVGEGLPRMVGESVLTLAAAPETGGASLLPWLARAGKVIGYGSAALRGTAETDSALGGAVSAGSLGLANKLIPAASGKAMRSVQDWLRQTGVDAVLPEASAIGRTEDILNKVQQSGALTQPQRLVAGAAGAGAGIAAGTGVNELTRQGEMSVGPHAVGLTDPARNPLTPENIAGNVAGALAFTPFIAHEIVRSPRTNLSNVEHLNKWLKEREQWNRNDAASLEGGVVDPALYEDVTGKPPPDGMYDRDGNLIPIEESWGKVPSENGTAVSGELDFSPDGSVVGTRGGDSGGVSADRGYDMLFRTTLDNLAQARRERRGDVAGQLEQQAYRLKEMLGHEDMDSIAEQVNGYETIARMAPPDSVKGFERFVKDLNGLIDQVNENTIKLSDEEKVKLKEGQDWHPQARSSEAVNQLGLMKPITADWLAKEYNATFDQSGNPEFAYRVVLQKVANRVLNGVDEALQNRKAVTEYSPRVKQTMDKDRAFIEALMSFPDEVRNQLANRTAEIYRMQDTPTTVGGGKTVMANPRRAWEMAVIQAAGTFDKETGTVRLKMSKKAEPEVVRLHELYLKDDNGNYIWQPPLKSGLVSEGTRKSNKEVSMRSIEQMGEKTGMEIPDEEEGFFHDLEQQEPATLLGKLGKLGGKEVPTEPGIVQEPTQGIESAYEKPAQEVKKMIGEMSDEELQKKLRKLFVPTSKTGLEYGADTPQMKGALEKLGRSRLAVEALLEDFVNSGQNLGEKAKSFLKQAQEGGFNYKGETDRVTFTQALRSFFGKVSDKVEIPEQLKGLPEDRQRAYQVLTSLVGEEKMKGLLGSGKVEESPMGLQSGTKESSIVAFPEGHPMEGQFAPDVTRTLRRSFQHRFREMGYAGSLADTYTEMATAIAMQKMGVKVDFYQLQSDVSGLASTRGLVGDETGMVGMNLNRPQRDAVTFVNDVLRTLNHELVHIDQKILSGNIKKPDAMSDEELKALRNLQKLGAALTPDERGTVLNTIRDAFVPKQFQVARSVNVGGKELPYGAHSTNEFMAEVTGLLTHGLFGGAPSKMKTAMDVLYFTPVEVYQFARGKYRQIADVLEAMRDVVRTTDGQYTSEAMETAIQTARSASKLRDKDFINSATRTMLQNLSPGAVLSLNQPSEAVWQYGREYVDPYNNFPEAMKAPQDEAVKAIGEVRKSLFGDPTERNTKPGVWARYLYPFTNLLFRMERAGIPLARDVWNLTQDIHPAIGRFQSSMMEPFLKKDANGRWVPDDSGLLLSKLENDQRGRWRDLFNRVRAFQNEHGSKQLFVQGEKGVEVAKEFEKQWEVLRKTFSPEDQQVAIAMTQAVDRTYQTAATHLTANLLQSIKNRTTAVFMTMNKGMTYEQAGQQAANAVDAVMTGKPLQIADIGQAETIAGLLGGSDGLIAKWGQVNEHLQGRPGFSSERLPGDWVIRFKNKDGEVKYLSAQSQRAAETLAGHLTSEGNMIDGEIFNKRDVSKYNDFDSPDDVLSKFIETEQAVWERFLTGVAQRKGQGLADELRSSFVPGEASAKALETKGLGQFLKERESKVDRTRFDYLDAMNDYVSKMSTSLVYRSIRQQLNLILNDPRGRAYPTFKKMVSDQFDYIMSPNPRGMQEFKSFMTSYFLGANLSSAIVEGTQSATTLVPTLMRLDSRGGGAVKAYGTLSKAIGNLFKLSRTTEWQKMARTAEGKDPSMWTEEESVAALYQRAVKDGLVDLGVINDPDYGRDQRTLWATRFGRGVDTPLTIGEMAKNKVYHASQMLMRLYSWTSTQNNKLAVLTGIQQGYEQGLRGDALYRHAQLVKSLSTFGGGKANSVGIASQFNSPLTRTAWGMASTLQQYGFGAVATYAELGREALGRTKGLNPIERRQAQKAFGTMLLTQVAIGGALSLPFAAAAVAFLEQYFGIEAGAAVRESLASLAGDDSVLGSVIADTALNGAGNQLTGLDISSRVGVSNLFGTSSYRGFSAADMYGPVGSILSNAVRGLNLFAQKEPLQAARTLAPAAFKAPFDILDSHTKYGDGSFRDQSGSLLYKPTGFQAAAYLLGFRPHALTQRRVAQKELALSQKNYQDSRSHELDSAAQDLLAGNPSRAQRYVDDLWSQDPTTNRREVYQSIVNRAAEATQEKDLLSTGSYGNAQEAREIAKSFGPQVVPRRSEVELLRTKIQLAASLGTPEALPDPSAFDRAVTVDGLVQKGMTRSEATRLTEFLSGGGGFGR